MSVFLALEGTFTGKCLKNAFMLGFQSLIPNPILK
jgi:hypothetical protein